MHPLGLLVSGETAEILEIRVNSKLIGIESKMHQTFLRLSEMGIRVGKNIEMLNGNNGNSVLIKVDNSRLAISRKIAMKIFVRRK